MSEKRYYWLKLKEDFFSSKRIKRLRNLAGGDTYTIIYLKMQLKALKTDGFLYFDGLLDTFADELALDVDESPDNVQKTIDYLCSNGLGMFFGDNVFRIFSCSEPRNRASREYKDWRRSVFERDNYTCQICGSRGAKLNAHHVKSWVDYPKDRYSVSNGLTLCEVCHKSIHRRK